jgi:hypoxanthine phosphoribosyltransferase
MLSSLEARNILDGAELLLSSEQVEAAVNHVAQEINDNLADKHPLVLSVMGGAVIFTGQLLPKLNFPLEFDYLHVSRYGNEKQGSELHWKVAPRENVRGKVVLVLDDILDEGETLHAIKNRVMTLGASQFYCAVFADKENGKDKPIHADFIGTSLPNRFVFGFGMDIHGAWRNLPAVYAVKE